MHDDAWDPRRYERFRAERREPFEDLLALVRPEPDMRVVDLGCGTGELTRDLRRHLGARETLGIDNSAAMLARSAAFEEDGLRFVRDDIATFATASAYDLVFSNAALHWLPRHEALLARLTAALAARGQLAVQVPANDDSPSHTTAVEVAGEEPFRSALAGPAWQANVLRPEEYAVVLDRLGYREQHVRLQVYAHRLASRDEVVGWVEGTLLTAWRRRLPDVLYAQFVERYRARLLPRLADTRPYFFPFKRILLWARR